MRLTTIPQVVKHSTRTCARTGCTSNAALHFNTTDKCYYCITCVNLIEESSSKVEFLKPMVKCPSCGENDLRFAASHVGMCFTCHKKAQLPSHVTLVKEETKEAVTKIVEEITHLSNIFKREPTQWRKVMELALELEQETMKL